MRFIKNFLGKNKKILLINVCKEKLHSLEFVKPIETILKSLNLKYKIANYKNISKSEIEKFDKIIICGTSLLDDDFLNYSKTFEWIRNCDKPILGICAGMQIIGKVFNLNVKKKNEIGFYLEDFEKEFLSLKELHEVYHLHNNYAEFEKSKEFGIFCSSGKVVQAIKHKSKEIYGVLFHPEVRNKKLIERFLK